MKNLLRMPKFLAYGLSLLVLATCTVGFSWGQSSKDGAKVKEMAHQELPLEVTLQTDKSAYKLSDRIRIQVLLINNSQSPIYVYTPLDWGESASLSLWLKDATSGKHVSQEFIADALPPPPSSKESFVEILPNHIYGVSLTTSLSELSVRKRGAYELVAEYHSPIPASMNFGLSTWSREKGPISSNHLRIAVVE